MHTEFAKLLRGYVERKEEKELYQASLLGKTCLKSELGPEEVAQIYFRTLDEVLSEHDSSEHKKIVETSLPVLIETMMVYSQNHREVQKVLDELKEKYRELDIAKVELERTYSNLETSKNELREKTAQLIQNEKMTALGELTAGVAHEINQPLNAISIICWDMFRDIQKKRFEPEQMAESLKEVITEVRKMAEIIDHMRVFTRRVDGSPKEEFNASIPFEGVFKLLGQQLKIRGIEITKKYEEGVSVLGNPVNLEQVIMNLITNARDAVSKNRRQKGMKIGVKTYIEKNDPKGETAVVYEVTDNGEGIPEELKDKIFEPFFTRKVPGEGTGLGLSVSRQIVEEHGGTMAVDSREGEGTSFKVIIPCATS